MATDRWRLEREPDFELWAEFIWVVAQWICEPHRLAEARSGGSRSEHAYPGGGACDSCYEEAYNLVYDGLRELMEVYGEVLYSSGRDNVGVNEANRNALEEMVVRARVL